MPKKKKNGHSALSGQSGENVNALYNNPGPNGAAAVTRDLSGPTMSDSSLQNTDEIVRSMQDMFPHLDPDVIHIVLSEADFKGKVRLAWISGPSEVSPLTQPQEQLFRNGALKRAKCESTGSGAGPGE